MAHPNKLQNARVLVFGGTSGIGFATASLCLSQGSYVTISGSNQGRIDNTVKRLHDAYPSIPKDRVSGYVVDLLDTPSLESNLKSLFETITSNGANKIDHIAFTAGDSLAIPKIQEVTAESSMQLGKVRLVAPIIIAKLLSTGTYMASSPSSSFTITGGVNTKKPLPGWAMGSAWGSMAEGLMRGLAVDLKPIRVNLVEPGAIQTPLLQGFIDRTGPGVLDMFKKGTLTGEVGQPEDTAEAYAWFMKDRFATGTVAQTNGGSLLT
ncbi:NAD(P)-binding protein [Zopfia rhizophila CBS 207.26]|uniref:NAD(P)-binding protein n=1 Tax=Zopfia rhizophila CBS 207.26 TaxID=1314779 RepID=A0A6A6E995_9PEZI|nr:NAD(P)-binding protein [Zopfia rhizophila CBS 207.26]